jgi:molybdopterin-guanine dinucleotide biosynthesis protein A
MKHKDVTGVILAGGASRRMGQNKGLLELNGTPLLAIIADRLRAVADEIIIVAGDAERYAGFADRCIGDVFPNVGTLGGIHAGLNAAGHELAAIVACDMPFLDPAVLLWFIDAAQDVDMVVLRHSKGFEPLHAVYHRRCLPAIESTIRRGERCAYAFYEQIRVRYVAPAEIAALDPTLRSFRNVNTPVQWAAAVAEAQASASLRGGTPA